MRKLLLTLTAVGLLVGATPAVKSLEPAGTIEAASAHTVSSTPKEQRGGLSGQITYLKRGLYHYRTAMKWCQTHRKLFNGRAGTLCYWPHYRAAQRASRRLAKAQARYNQLYSTGGSYASVAAIVCQLDWSPFSCSQVMQVINCETGGTYSIYTQTGQYMGLFQMGDYARSAYGHAYTVWGQARSAYAYFVAAGRDFSPWQCSPYGGLQW